MCSGVPTASLKATKGYEIATLTHQNLLSENLLNVCPVKAPVNTKLEWRHNASKRGGMGMGEEALYRQ